MADWDDLLESVADTLADYRAGEIAEPTVEHVDRWIGQFDEAVREPLLGELDHVLKQTYFSRENVAEFFAHLIKHEEIAGTDFCEFWEDAHVLDIQEHGHSQSEIRALFGEALLDRCGLEIDDCGADGGAYIYLDDALFSGGRIGNDLSKWILNDAPSSATVHVIVIAAHKLGEWQTGKRLEAVADEAGKKIDRHSWAVIRIENRLKYRDKSEVLWPATLPEDAEVNAYVAKEQKFPFQPRHPGGALEHAIFSSEDGRQLLERELLLAGVRIRGFSQNPSAILRPLGYSPFGLGFGSMIVTYRNCPNNAPLALWWGDPSAPSTHPFSKWYPLVPRKTYAAEKDPDDFSF